MEMHSRDRAMSRCNICWISLAILSMVSSATLVAGTKAPAIFLLGDSVLDSGTNNYITTTFKANFTPYGENYFYKPTGRFSDGRTIGDFAAERLNLPSPPPYLQPNSNYSNGASFASAGSGILDTTYSGQTVSLTQQVEQYYNMSAGLVSSLGNLSQAANIIMDGILLISEGANDLIYYLNSTTLQSQFNSTDYIQQLMIAYSAAFIKLYDCGARNFVVLGVGQIGCSPKERLAGATEQCSDELNQLVVDFNTALNATLTRLVQGFPSGWLITIDLYDPQADFLANAAHYGFTNTTAACCGTGELQAKSQCGTVTPEYLCSNSSQFVYWDYLNPTEYTNSLLFDVIWSGNSSYANPYNLSYVSSL